jgi:DNA repair ATPase RecN
VRKGVVGDRTVTSVDPLDGEEREQELAGMLGAITEQTRASAREMMAASEADKRR